MNNNSQKLLERLRDRVGEHVCFFCFFKYLKILRTFEWYQNIILN